ncbi:asparagine synthase (glutamine-hydrolyzing) [Candidatus Pelagibacter sp.]|nr:asparagine synthase (glutamine-hydrolyzing) [Candidatus Pelagibacter sp.]
MCGLIGYFQTQNGYFTSEKISKFNKLLSKLDCRGPDNKEYFVDNEKKIYLGHTRLSIIDLSQNSNQPIFSLNKNFIMVFNGEIYNHKELYNRISNLNITAEVQKSDTRILLEHISHFGLFETLKIVNGMYSISLYDLKKKKLYLARDYWGKKPLYYFFNDKKIFFSSTISPIIESKILPNKINPLALNQYFQQGFIIGHEGSIIDGVSQLKPNSIIEFDLSKEKFIKLEERLIIKKNISEKKLFHIDQLEDKIIKSVDLRLQSDVNAGLLLSSGIDSSLIASISSKINKNIDSFSVGFDHIYKNDDETEIAKTISTKLGIRNHKLAIEEKDILDFINNIENAFDEPFADSSQIPSMIVFSKISKFAKIAITGDGGDEIFYGYNRYKYYNYWNNGLKFAKPFLKILNNKKLKNILYKKINYKSVSQIEKFMNTFVMVNNIKYSNFTKLSFNDPLIKDTNNKKNDSCQILENLETLRNCDIENYMAYDILTKIDRSSMYFSVEARSPLLDINIFDYLKNSTIGQNINLINNKILLKKILKKYLPSNLINNSKKGFSIPIDKVLLYSVKKKYFDLFEYVKLNKLIDNLNNDNIEKYTHKFFVKKDLKYVSIIWAIFVYFKWLVKYEKYLEIN